MTQGKRVVITGASGFVGANLARELVRQGHTVELLLREGYFDWRVKDMAADVQTTIVNLSDLAAVRRVMQQTKPDWIFHLAVYGAYPTQTDWKQMVETNIVGTYNLLKAAREVGFEAFINTGSSSEYGYKTSAPSEDDLTEPNSDYAISKVAATLKCGLVGRSENLPVCTLRLYSVFGPFEEPTRLLPALAINGLKGTLPPLVNPSVARDFVYVDDVVEAYIAAAKNAARFPGHVFNVGSGIQTTLADAVEAARSEFRISEQPEWGSMPSRSWDTTVWVSDNRKIRRELGWEPRTSFADGLAKFGRWLKFDRARFEFYESRLQG
jgi:dolichol-phosphate mannosyltransferase